MDPSSSEGGIKRRACTNCTVAKARCTPYSREMCTRCQRLRKNCVYLNISATRRKPRDNTRVQKLEVRLEELFDQISNIPIQPPLPATSAAQTTLVGQLPSTNPRHVGPLPISGPGSASNSASHVASWIETVSTPSLLHDDDGQDIVDRGILTLDCARTLLDTFRFSYTNYYPFVILPPGLSVESLRREKPFLFISVVAVAAFGNSPLQQLLTKEIQRQVATRIVMRNEKSIDILQGLLVHLAYYHYFFSRENQQIYLMIQLSLTLIYELGLHHPARPKKFEGGPTEWGKMGSAERYGKRTTEELRTFLGIYVLSDDIAKMYRKQNLVCDPEFALQCCQQLVDIDERPTDRWIQRYVQLNILSRQINDVFNYYNPKNSKITGEANIRTAVDSFKRELENLTRDIRSDALDQEAFLLREVQFLHIWIHEVALHDVVWETPISAMPTAASPIPSTRVNMLWNCLTAAKVYATNFLDIPRVQMFQLPFPTLSKICYVLMVFCKTVFFHVEKDSPISETGESRNSTNLPPSNVRSEGPLDTVLAACQGEFYHIGSALQEKFAALVTSTSGKNGELDAMWHFALFIKRIMAGYERRMEKLQDSSAEREYQQQDTSHSGNNTNNTANTSINNHPVQDPQPTTSYYIPHDRINGASSQTQLNTHMMDISATTRPFDLASVNTPPEWVQDMEWEAIMDDIMLLPVMYC